MRYAGPQVHRIDRSQFLERNRSGESLPKHGQLLIHFLNCRSDSAAASADFGNGKLRGFDMVRLAQSRRDQRGQRGRGPKDVGIEVAEVEPLLVTHNDKGEVEGVKYDRISVVLINAIREQQAQITAMQKESLEVKARLATLERVGQQPRNDQFQNANKENGSEKKEP
jgi:hypothetical protein